MAFRGTVSPRSPAHACEARSTRPRTARRTSAYAGRACPQSAARSQARPDDRGRGLEPDCLDASGLGQRARVHSVRSLPRYLDSPHSFTGPIRRLPGTAGPTEKGKGAGRGRAPLRFYRRRERWRGRRRARSAASPGAKGTSPRRTPREGGRAPRRPVERHTDAPRTRAPPRASAGKRCSSRPGSKQFPPSAATVHVSAPVHCSRLTLVLPLKSTRLCHVVTHSRSPSGAPPPRRTTPG